MEITQALGQTIKCSLKATKKIPDLLEFLLLSCHIIL